MFDGLLYTALVVCLTGIGDKFIKFKQTGRRLNFAAGPKMNRGKFAQGSFSSWILIRWLSNSLSGLFNILFQYRLFKAGKIRWLIHFFVFSGFMYLLVVHGLHSLTADLLFDYYEPTLDPFQFLRNLSGVLVIIGCLAFVIRRALTLRINADSSVRYKGIFSILLILSVVVSGFLLETAKIISEPVFMEMVDEYSDLYDEPELDDLKLFWHKSFKVYFDPVSQLSDADVENGRMLNDEYCLSCHSDTRSAFFSIRSAGLMQMASGYINRHRLDRVLYWVHYILCLGMLAVFPFSRLLHVMLVPFTSFIPPLKEKDGLHGSPVLNTATLHACTNCGYCSQVCSVYPHFQVLLNKDILPHSKIESAKAFLAKPEGDFSSLFSGNHLCTLCYHCTDICPSGIDLQSLWIALEGVLDQDDKKRTKILTPIFEPMISSQLIGKTDDFEACIQCTFCTNVCPVVEFDSTDNDYTPQQVMNLLRLGHCRQAGDSRMVQTCLTCYACQEICPQKIKVTDILLELRAKGGVDIEAGTPVIKNELI